MMMVSENSQWRSHILDKKSVSGLFSACLETRLKFSKVLRHL